MTDDDPGGSDSASPVLVLLFLFTGLGFGIFLEQLMSRTSNGVINNIPYTCILFVVGMSLAAISKSTFDGDFAQSLTDWIHIDADLMLFIFLPPLVFGEAMALSWYHVKRALPQCLLLAGPGVLLGTAFMGLLTKAILPYNWPWLLCFLFSSVLAATDTVAVLSIMQTAGASPKLSIIIVGESLFNDGTGMVMFVLFLRWMMYPEQVSILSTLSFAIQMTLGSLSLGAAIGFLTVKWLKSINRPLKEVDIASQITITICVAYLTFFLAQYVLKISGILTLVGAALILAWQAPPIILNRETMHTIWSFIEWVGNTLIFLLAGLIIGHRVLGEVIAMDWLYMILLYLACQLVRILIIAICYPIMKQVGTKMTRNEAYFAAFAGLRGALGMALGLIVVDNAEFIGIDDASAKRVFFYIGGIVALSLLINGSCSRLVLDLLDLSSTDSVQQLLIMDQIKKRMRKKMNRFIEKMETELDISPADVMEIRMSCSILRPSDLESDLLQSLTANAEASISARMSARNALTEAMNMGPSNNTAADHYSNNSNNNRGVNHAVAALDKMTSSNNKNNSKKKNKSNSKSNKGEKKSGSAPTSTSNSYALSPPNSKSSTMPHDTNGHPGGHDSDEHDDADSDAEDDAYRNTLDITEDSWLDANQVAQANAYNDISGVAMTRGRSSTHNIGSPIPTNGGGQKTNKQQPLYDPGMEKANAGAAGGFGRRLSRGRTWSVGSLVQQGHEGRWSRQNSQHSTTSEWNLLGNIPTLPVITHKNEERLLRYSNMNELLDPHKRKTTKIIPEMLSHVRTVFLEIVRVQYWKLIEGGKLPRNCSSAFFLLYTVDVGIDEAKDLKDTSKKKSLLEREAEMDYYEEKNPDGLGDWKCIKEDIDHVPLGTNILQWCENILPPSCGGDFAGNLIEYRKSLKDTRAVYILTAFIEAHEHAQKKIHSFVGVENEDNVEDEGEEEKAGRTSDNDDQDDDTSEDTRNNNTGIATENPTYNRPRTNTADSDAFREHTPEELKVKEESAALVAKAREYLLKVEEDTISEIKAKQAAMTVLVREVDLVRHMAEEGLLNNNQANRFLEEISIDRQLLESESSNLFRRRRYTPNNAESNKVYAPLIDNSLARREDI